MKTITLSLLGLLFASSIFAQPRIQFDAEHPDVHDPVMAKGEDGKYYLFTTGFGVGVISSADLQGWQREQPVFSEAPGWAVEEVKGYNGHTWAPDISYHNGQWYLYYSCSTFGKNGSAIGLTTNKTLNPHSPEFKWQDQGLVIASHKGVDNWNAIDPNLIVDSEGIPFLVYGSFWDGIQLVQLSKEDFKTPVTKPVTVARRLEHEVEPGEIKFTQEGENIIEAGDNAIEAPFIYKHGDYYYLFVSFDYCCRGENSTYKTVYGRSKNPAGPYLDQDGKSMAYGGGTYLFGPDKDYFGVGHCSVYDVEGKTMFFSHAYEKAYDGRSKLFIRELTFDQEGWIITETK